MALAVRTTDTKGLGNALRRENRHSPRHPNASMAGRVGNEFAVAVVPLIRNPPVHYGRSIMPKRSALPLVIVSIVVCFMANDVLAADDFAAPAFDQRWRQDEQITP